jgi:hypothetical protein
MDAREHPDAAIRGRGYVLLDKAGTVLASIGIDENAER